MASSPAVSKTSADYLQMYETQLKAVSLMFQTATEQVKQLAKQVMI